MMKFIGVAASLAMLSACAVVYEGADAEIVEDDAAIFHRGSTWAPDASPPYSAMVSHDDVIYLAGMLGTDPETRALPDGIAAQTANALGAIERELQAVGADLSDLLTCTCYLADIGDYQAFNAAYSAILTDNPPARTTIGVAGLPLGAAVEISCIAARPE
ncbi:MAG: RidA family protein [Pseudomonadota bacterium]